MIHALLDRQVRSGAIAGALVAVGETEAVTAAGVQGLETGAPMRPDTMLRIMAMTEPVTAAAAMILVAEGRITLDDDVARFPTEMADHRRATVTADPRSGTIAQLLTQHLMTGADDVAIATELGRTVVPAANTGEDLP